MIGIIDIVIIVVYMSLIIVIGYLSGKKNNTQEDFLLAGRSMPWIPIAFSIAATTISANAFIGAPGWAYMSSMAPFMTNIAVPLAVLFALVVTVPIFYNLKVVSIYEYMEHRFGVFTRTLTVIQFFINSLIQVSSMVFIPSLIIEAITGWNFGLIVAIVVIVSIIYTIIGGIRAVIWTDFTQMIIVWGSAFLIVILILNALDLTIFDSISAAKSSGKFDVFDMSFNIKSSTAFYATLIGGAFLWIRYFSFDQVQVQRVLTAKSIVSTKMSLSLSALLMNSIFFFMLFIGILLFQFYNGKEFESTNQIMIEYILNHIPVGLVGIVISGALASAMSSVDSLLNSMTTVFIKDVYEKYFKKTKGETSLKLTMLISGIFGIVIILFVIIGFSNSVKSIIELVGTYISYFSGPTCAVFLLAIFSNKTNDKTASIGFIIGIILGFIVAKQYETSWIVNPAIGGVITLLSANLLNFVIKSDERDINRAKNYTAMGIRKKLISEDDTLENGYNKLPFYFDKYAVITLIIFLSQYLIFYLLNL